MFSLKSNNPLQDYSDQLLKQKYRFKHAVLASALIILPAYVMYFMGAFHLIFSMELGAFYGLLIGILGRRLLWVSPLMMPLLFVGGHLLAPYPWIFGMGLVGLTVLMAVSTLKGMQKGVHFWVNAYLIGGLIKDLPGSEADHFTLMFLGVCWGGLLAVTILQPWFKKMPGICMGEAMTFGSYLIPATFLAWQFGLMLSGPHTWWLAVVVLALCDPSSEKMRQQGKERIIGTLHGAVLSWLIAVAHFHPLVHGVVMFLVLVATLMLLGEYYRGFTAGVTVVIMSLQPIHHLGKSMMERVEDTVLAAGMLVLMAGLAWLQLKLRKRWNVLISDGTSPKP